MPTTPNYQRVQRGDRTVPATLLNAHSESLEVLLDPSAAGGGSDFGQLVLPQPPETRFLAKITAKDDSTTPPSYYWLRVPQRENGDPFQTHPDGDAVQGGPGEACYRAFEHNSNPDVPAGAVVEMHFAEGWSYYWFNYLSQFDGPVTITAPYGDALIFLDPQTGAQRNVKTVSATETVDTYFGPGTDPATYTAGVTNTTATVTATGGGTDPPVAVTTVSGTTYTESITPAGTDNPAKVTTATGTSFTEATYTPGTTDDAIVVTASTTQTSLTLEAVSGQSANLQEWRDSTGAAVASISAAGALTATSISGSSTWIKRTKTYTDFAAASTTNQIDLYELPAGSVFHEYVVKHSASFTGGAIATYTLALGTLSSPSQYFSSWDVFTATGNTVFTFSKSFAGAPIQDHVTFTTRMLRLQATSSGANLDQATAGSVDVWLLVSTLP